MVAKVEELENAGKSTMLVQHGTTLLGVVALADLARDNAASTLRSLSALGIEQTVMLTGDNEKVAGVIARQVGIADVRAGLIPRAVFFGTEGG